MKLYSGIDPHSSNSYPAIIDESGKAIFKEKLSNGITVISEMLCCIAALSEGSWLSTCNWYWLVDGLIAAAFRMRAACSTGQLAKIMA